MELTVSAETQNRIREDLHLRFCKHCRAAKHKTFMDIQFNSSWSCRPNSSPSLKTLDLAVRCGALSSGFGPHPCSEAHVGIDLHPCRSAQRRTYTDSLKKILTSMFCKKYLFIIIFVFILLYIYSTNRFVDYDLARCMFQYTTFLTKIPESVLLHQFSPKRVVRSCRDATLESGARHPRSK